MALRPSAVVCLVVAAAVLARAGDGDAPAPSKAAESVKFGPAPEGLRLEIRAPKSTYWPGESIRPDVALVNGSKKDVNVVLSRYGSEHGGREPMLDWTAAYVAADGKETPVEPEKSVLRCGTGTDHEWQDDVVALKPGARTPLEVHFDPAVTLDLQAPGKVRLRLRYAYSAGKATTDSLPAVCNVPKGTGAMGSQEPFELVGTAEFTIERPLDVVVWASSSPHAGPETRVTDVLDVRAVGTDGKLRTLAAAKWDVALEFDEPWELPLDTSKCWKPRTLAQDASVPGSGAASLALDPSMTLRAEKPFKCRVRAVLRSLDPPGGPRIRSTWTELRFTE